MGNGGDLVCHVHHIRCLNGGIRAAAHGSAHISTGQHRGIVDAVAHKQHRTVLLPQLGQSGQLALRQQPGEDLLDARFFCHCPGALIPVACEHGAADAHTLQGGDGLPGVFLQGISQLQPAGEAAVNSHKHNSAICRDAFRHFHAEALHQPSIAAKHLMPVRTAPDAAACQLFQVFCRHGGDPPLCGVGEDTRGNGMGGMLLPGSAQAEHLLRALHLLHPELPFCHRTGFIQSGNFNTRQRFNGKTALEQDAHAATLADAGEKGQRHTEHQSTGAAHYQKRKSGIDPIVPLPGEDGGDHRRQHCRSHHNGGVDPGKPGDEPVDLRLACRGGFHCP